MTRLAPKRVLIIDDNEDYRNLLLRFLKKAFPDAESHTYSPASAGPPGPKFDWSKFDVLIMEYQLGPDQNGLDWLRKFKSETKNFPATILLTASGNEEIAVRALRYGAHDYLRKQNLSAKRLSESVADAFNVRERQSSATQSLTINASRFSKSFFYGQFSLAFDEAEKGENRALVLIRVDGYEALRDSVGVLGTDVIARHLARIGTKVFHIDSFRPRATRFTDSTIAMLVGQYKSPDNLEHLLRKLCELIDNDPPVVRGSPVQIAVSVGAVVFKSRTPGVPGLLEQAERAASEAARSQSSSVVIQTSAAAAGQGLDTGERAKIFDAREAVRENRIQSMFQALMKVSDKSSELPLTDFFQILPRFVAHNGETIDVDSVVSGQKDNDLSRIIDRWKIRECVGRLLSENFPDAESLGFHIELSEASCTDVNLAGWIGALIKHLGSKRRLGQVCLGISPDVFMRHLKPLLAFLGHLRKQHGFTFALEGVDDLSLCKVCFAQFPFDLVSLSSSVVEQIIAAGAPAGESEKLLEFIAERGALSIAVGIENANSLAAVIGSGVDFVQGDFIAPKQEEIEAAVGIESVQIGS